MPSMGYRSDYMPTTKSTLLVLWSATDPIVVAPITRILAFIIFSSIVIQTKVLITIKNTNNKVNHVNSYIIKVIIT